MTSFDRFSKRCKMRLDFDDQIQVRYTHGDGQNFDTWVSGAEALQRLETTEAKDHLRSLSQLSADDLKIVLHSLPDSARNHVRRLLRDRIADQVQSTIGGNLIGDALADAVRGRDRAGEARLSPEDRWLALMRYEPFRLRVLELAWTQLEGSFPDDESRPEPDDWL